MDTEWLPLRGWGGGGVHISAERLSKLTRCISGH